MSPVVQAHEKSLAIQYVHAIHSFQAFDIDGIDFTDPVEAMRYDHHIEHVCPNFTILNCESCHNTGKYNVPDQSKLLPGVLSASDNAAALTLHGFNRNIGTVPMYVTGAASKACGGCHRAARIKEDDAAGLAAFNSHTGTNGILLETDSNNYAADFNKVIHTIMGYFEDGVVLAHQGKNQGRRAPRGPSSRL